MLTGLAMDIIGVWMLAGPLLKVDLTKKGILEKRTKEAIEEFQKVKDQKPGQPDSKIAMWSGVARLEAVVNQLHLRILEEKIEHRHRAIWALVIITVGFFLMMVANLIQAFWR